MKKGYALVIRKEPPLYSDGKVEVTDVTEDILKLVDAAPAADKRNQEIEKPWPHNKDTKNGLPEQRRPFFLRLGISICEELSPLRRSLLRPGHL